MSVNRDLIEATRQTPEYRNGLAILGDPDDYAAKTMLAFVGFFYLLTIEHQGNVEGLDAFVQQIGITPGNPENDMQFRSEDEEALSTAFVYIVGRNSREFFEEFLRFQNEHPDGVRYSTEQEIQNQ